MHDVPACGLQPNKQAWSDKGHTVGLVYASAVPVDAYLNRATTKTEQKLHGKMAEAILVAQYYGALHQIAYSVWHNRNADRGNRTKVYLLPLGGGVFNNSWESIGRAMCLAVQMLSNRPELLDCLEVDALTWSGNPSEKMTLERELAKGNKLAKSRHGTLSRALAVARQALAPQGWAGMR